MRSSRRNCAVRSAAGKARAACNAHRHGLSQSILADPSAANKVEKLARELARSAPGLDLIDLTRRVAEAHLDAQRIRLYRHTRLVQAVQESVGMCTIDPDHGGGPRDDFECGSAGARCDAAGGGARARRAL